ncbi:glucokinase [Alcaligenaceae bacterium]|nr:glucokinase [Alcaligenaceae bacterium]
MISTGTTKPLRLVADIGGTHARFALCSSVNDIKHISVLASDDFPSIDAAIHHYLSQHGNPGVETAVIGIANPVLGDQIKMTNHPWSFSIEQTRKALGLKHMHVINDFTALALSLPHLPSNELTQVGGGPGAKNTPMAVLGPGTGLGVSALIPTPQGSFVPLAAEGGHVSFSPENEQELILWREARDEYGHVSVERLVSGPGLVFIYESLCRAQGQSPEKYTPSDISEHAIANTDPLCREALDTLCAILGTVASNLAVTLGARAGVYIGGGIIKRLGSYFAQSPFRARFENKGRFSSYLAAIPVYVIQSKQPALLGAAAYESAGG